MIHVIIGSGLRRGLRIRVELSAGVIRDCSLTAVATVRAQAAATRRRTGQGEMTPLSSRIHRKALGPGPSIPGRRVRAGPIGVDPPANPRARFATFLSFSFFLSLSCSLLSRYRNRYIEIERGPHVSRGPVGCSR